MHYKDDWANAKLEYFKLTGQKKPAETVLRFFTTSHTGLSPSLEAIDKFMDKYKDEGDPDDFEKLKKNFEGHAVSYVKLLLHLRDDLAKDPDIEKQKLHAGVEYLEKKLKSYARDFDAYLTTRRAYTDELVKLVEVFGRVVSLHHANVKKAIARYYAEDKLLGAIKLKGPEDTYVKEWNDKALPILDELNDAIQKGADQLNFAVDTRAKTHDADVMQAIDKLGNVAGMMKACEDAKRPLGEANKKARDVKEVVAHAAKADKAVADLAKAFA